MVFSSIPAYLDPANWQQQSGDSIPNHHQLTSPLSQTATPPPLPPPPPPQPHGSGDAGFIRPGSMADRARLANIPMPETAQKCPRCESSNTKFCYFNNYSLSQPRHFCKTCRRYWTRGGALRNVPVGGGCRRNKRSSSKSSNNNNNNNNNNTSKSPASSTSTDGRQAANNNSGSTSTISSHSNSFSGPTSAVSLLGLMSPQIPPLRFMSPLGQLTDHHHHHQFSTPGNNMNLNFSTSGNVLGGTSEGMMVNNNNLLGAGAGGGDGVALLLSSVNVEHWRMQQQQQQQMAQQFPNFLGGFDPSNSPAGVNNYQFQGGVNEAVQFLGGNESTTSQIRPKISTSMLNQMASVKMEDNNHNQDQSALSRQLLGIQGNENWNTASAWSDLSASFSSSSTSNAL